MVQCRHEDGYRRQLIAYTVMGHANDHAQSRWAQVLQKTILRLCSKTHMNVQKGKGKHAPEEYNLEALNSAQL
jgi:hypothetical protein